MELQGCRNPDLIPLLRPPDGFSQKGKPLWTWEKIKSGGVDAVKRRVAERRKYLRSFRNFARSETQDQSTDARTFAVFSELKDPFLFIKVDK